MNKFFRAFLIFIAILVAALLAFGFSYEFIPSFTERVDAAREARTHRENQERLQNEDGDTQAELSQEEHIAASVDRFFSNVSLGSMTYVGAQPGEMTDEVRDGERFETITGMVTVIEDGTKKDVPYTIVQNADDPAAYIFGRVADLQLVVDKY